MPASRERRVRHPAVPGRVLTNDHSIMANYSTQGKAQATFAQVWDAATGEPLGTPLRHHGAVNSAAFSSDGTRERIDVSYDTNGDGMSAVGEITSTAFDGSCATALLACVLALSLRRRATDEGTPDAHSDHETHDQTRVS